MVCCNQVLISKEKLKYIEEEPGDAISSEWKEDAHFRSWLWNSMESHISCTVMFWTLHMLFGNQIYETFASDTNVQRIYDVCEEAFLSKQGTKSHAEYYSFVRPRWEELNIYHPYPTDIVIWNEQRELKVVSFLSGLTSHHASAQVQILNGNELPSLNAVFSRSSRVRGRIC